MNPGANVVEVCAVDHIDRRGLAAPILRRIWDRPTPPPVLATTKVVECGAHSWVRFLPIQILVEIHLLIAALAILIIGTKGA